MSVRVNPAHVVTGAVETIVVGVRSGNIVIEKQKQKQ
jgi:hypothetical protein